LYYEKAMTYFEASMDHGDIVCIINGEAGRGDEVLTSKGCT
jgi:hypothetical protein